MNGVQCGAGLGQEPEPLTDYDISSHGAKQTLVLALVIYFLEKQIWLSTWAVCPRLERLE